MTRISAPRPGRPGRRWHALALIAVGLTVSGVLSACGAGGSAAGKTYRISFGSPNPATSVDGVALQKWSDQVKRDTNGKVLITLRSNAQLGNDATEMTAVQRGSQQGFAGTAADLENYTDSVDILDLPYIFPRAETDAQPLLFGQLGKSLAADAQAKGFQVVGWLDEGARQLFSKNPITTPGQLNGVKVRVQPAPVPEGMYRAVGANLNAIAFADVYTALQTNVVSAFDEPVDDLYQQKFYQLISYMAPVGAVLTVNPMVVNLDFWRSLPAAYQKIVSDDAQAMAKDQWKQQITATDADVKDMQSKGLKVLPVDVSQWQAVWTPFADSYVKKLPANVQSLYAQVKAQERTGTPAN